MALADRCRREIEDLHAFFAAWFNGELDRGELDRLDAALAEDFHLIPPDGTTIAKPALMERLRAAYGTRAGAETPLQIGIRNPTVRLEEPGICVLTYEEWQRPDPGHATAGSGSARLSTVVFSEHADGPNGVVWRHVHEVWLPDAA